MASSQQTALHVLRLVLHNKPLRSLAADSRRFSVAVSSNYTQSSPPSASSSTSRTAAWGPRHASSDFEGQSGFLEDTADSEYTSAALTLPERATQATAHWATLFADPSENTPGNQLARRVPRCEVLARLVIAGDLVTARTVYNELSALHIGVMRRSIYLSAAMSSLEQTTAGKTAFLFWLELVPNRPAVRTHSGTQAVWQPVIDRLINDFSADREFILDFLKLSARKGFLPSVCAPLMRHLALFTSPEVLRAQMDQLVQTFLASTTSLHSTSARAGAHRASAHWRVEEMWNAYARGLAAAHWADAVKELVGDATTGIQWTEDTLAYLAEKTSSSGAGVKSAGTVAAPTLDVSSTATETTHRQVRIVRRVRLARLGAVKPSEMADVLEILQQNGRTSLLHRLEHNMAQSPNYTQREMWYHAAMLLARRRGLGHAAVLAIFERNFMWIGVPRIQLATSAGDAVGVSVDGQGREKGTGQVTTGPMEDVGALLLQGSQPLRPYQRKLWPSPALLTTLLPSLLSLLPAPLEASISGYHSTYLAALATLAPRLRPVATTHSVILRTITHLLGPYAGIEALRNMVHHGTQPSLADYNAVVWSMAGRGEWVNLKNFLSAMEKSLSITAAANLAAGSPDTANALLAPQIASGHPINPVNRSISFLVQSPELAPVLGTMPRPDKATYTGIAGILERAGMTEEARLIRNRVRSIYFAGHDSPPHPRTSEGGLSSNTGISITTAAAVLDMEDKHLMWVNQKVKRKLLRQQERQEFRTAAQIKANKAVRAVTGVSSSADMVLFTPETSRQGRARNRPEVLRQEHDQRDAEEQRAVSYA